jgi:mitogen-activated protein kinase 1/3
VAKILALREVILPPRRDTFRDVYIVSELMDSDLQNIIRTQELTEEHHKVLK